MKWLTTFLFSIAICNFALSQEKLVPASYEILQQIQGDLNKDGIDEKVVVYNMKDSLDEMEGICRDIVIFKKEKQDWVIWRRSKSAIMGSKSGGMMRDPYGEIEIKNGILLVHQYGGSSWKWGTVDKYRFQFNSFELVGYTSSYGKLCEYWLEIDFNISTGKLNIKKEYENCDNQQQVIFKKENESFIHKLKNKITLENRKAAEIEIISPKYKHELYL